jgi:hypothetical protein
MKSIALLIASTKSLDEFVGDKELDIDLFILYKQDKFFQELRLQNCKMSEEIMLSPRQCLGAASAFIAICELVGRSDTCSLCFLSPLKLPSLLQNAPKELQVPNHFL